MKNKHYLILLILFLLMTAHCSKNSQPSAINSPTPSTTKSKPEKSQIDPLAKSIADPITNEKALEFLYKNYNAREKYSSWQPTDEEMTQIDKDKKYADYEEWRKLQVSVVMSKRFTQSGKEHYLLLTKAAPEKLDFCPNCIPEIGVAIFSKDGDQWQVDLNKRNLGYIGRYGEAAKASFVKVGPDKYGVIFQPFASPKIDVEQFSLFLFVYQDRSFKNVLFIYQNDVAASLYEENMAEPKHGSTYELVPGKNRDFYDLKLITIGNRFDKEYENISPVNEMTIYTFSKDKYVLASKTDLITED